MERPSSQAENVRPSGLKQPSRLPALASGRTLVETSQSDLNARSAPHGGLMQPSIIPSKHKVPGLPEPATKRKTLAERAGETNTTRSHIPGKPSFSRTTDGSLLGSRVPSNSNGFRPHQSQSSISSIGRPQSRGNVLRQTYNAPIPRISQAATQDDDDDDDDADLGVMGKRKGTPLNGFHNLTLRKTRTTGDLRQKRQQHASVNTRSQHSGTSTLGCADDRESSGSEQASRSTSYASTTSSTCQEPIGEQCRNISLTNAFAELSLTPRQHDPLKKPSTTKHRPSLERIKEELSPSKIPKYSCTPSLRHTQSSVALQTPSPLKHKPSKNGMRSIKKRPDVLPVYLTKETLTPLPAWDTKGRLEDMEQMYTQLRSQFASAADSKTVLEESLSLYKSRVEEFTLANRELTTANRTLTADLDRARSDLHMTTTDLRQAKRDQERDVQDAERRHEKETSDMISKHERELHELEREREKEKDRFQKEMDEARQKWQREKDDETADMTTAHWEELDEVRKKHEQELAGVQSQLDTLRQSGESRATESATEVKSLREQLSSLESQVESGKSTVTSLRARVSAEESKCAALEQEKAALVSKTHFLEGNQEAQSHEYSSMREQLDEAVKARDATLETLRKEEMLRRKLNATILELRGNIRVFTRLRPLLNGEDDPAKIDFPDQESLDGGKEMVVYAPTTKTATGKEVNDKHDYSFDRAFGPGTPNDKVFEECRDLIQSVVDGYNVSILSYGQTGSGKTYGMSGPDGIIPSSIGLLLSEMQRVKEKGWDYEVHASFVEVYNETLNDLLGDAKTWDDGSDGTKGKKKEKHEIHHDAITGKTTVTNLSSVSLWPPPETEGRCLRSSPTKGLSNGDAAAYTEETVNQLLETAAKNRRVAATKANERSSRSHSIFMLTLRGHCESSGDSSEGTLNLVDLAGSERLKQSGAEGNRMKETQAINKSLSSLGDVIAALGSKNGKEAHIPYRNSKLTYLLQSSLGGTAANGKSSRTLMLLHLSPLQQHWQESRSSLLFGSKVHSTHIGSAKKR